MRKSIVLFLLFLLPSFVSAAGFATQSIFLSQNQVTEGQTVLIHTVLSNTNNTAFTGKVEFMDGTESLGTVPVTLSAFQADTFSISWKPSAGSHTVTANLYDSDQLFVGETHATFFVATATTSTETVESSQPLDAAVQSLSPAIAQTVAPAFAAIDSGRTQANTALTKALSWTQTQLHTKPIQAVLGAHTQKATTTNTSTVTTNLWNMLLTALLYVLTAIRFCITHIWAFYPIAAFLLLYILWRLSRGIQRPRR